MKNFILTSISCCLCLVFMSKVEVAQNVEHKAKDLTFKVGQIWSYKTRANEPKSTFVIVKIDSDVDYGNIIHIAVSNLKMKNLRSPDGVSDKINHMPFAEKAVAQSAVKMLKEDAALPEFEAGYDLWRKAFDEKRAGFYTITIADAVKIAEETLNQ
jgi:hypothetical protein